MPASGTQEAKTVGLGLSRVQSQPELHGAIPFPKEKGVGNNNVTVNKKKYILDGDGRVYV